jgi:hypothetical protein
MSIEKPPQAELETLRLPVLQALPRSGRRDHRSPKRTFLIRRITEALAAMPQEVAVEPLVAVVQPEVQVEMVVQAEAPVANATPESPDCELGAECEGCPVCEAPVETETPSPALSAEDAPVEKKSRGRFAAMTIEEPGAKYLEVLGRTTGSSDRGYLLIWKVREAEKGRLTVGPRQARATEGNTDEAKTLPLRLDTPAITAMDAAWRQQGIPSPTEFLPCAIGQNHSHLGATDAPALFATK